MKGLKLHIRMRLSVIGRMLRENVKYSGCVWYDSIYITYNNR